jgi:hypothetical protein
MVYFGEVLGMTNECDDRITTKNQIFDRFEDIIAYERVNGTLLLPLRMMLSRNPEEQCCTIVSIWSRRSRGRGGLEFVSNDNRKPGRHSGTISRWITEKMCSVSFTRLRCETHPRSRAVISESNRPELSMASPADGI